MDRVYHLPATPRVVKTTCFHTVDVSPPHPPPHSRALQPYRAPRGGSCNRPAADGVGSHCHDEGDWNVFYIFLHNVDFSEVTRHGKRQRFEEGSVFFFFFFLLVCRRSYGYVFCGNDCAKVGWLTEDVGKLFKVNFICRRGTRGIVSMMLPRILLFCFEFTLNN